MIKISVERMHAMGKAESMLEGMNEWIMEMWLEKNCQRSSPDGCNNFNTWDWHTHRFATQIGTFKTRIWVCSHRIGHFAWHWTWEIINKYQSVNELGNFFFETSPKTKITKPSSTVRIIHLALTSQKQPYTFSHDRTYIMSYRWLLLGHLGHPPNSLLSMQERKAWMQSYVFSSQKEIQGLRFHTFLDHQIIFQH